MTRVYNYILNEYEMDDTGTVVPGTASTQIKQCIVMPQNNTKMYELFSRPITDVTDLTVHGMLSVEGDTQLEQDLSVLGTTVFEQDVTMSLGLSALGAVYLDSDLNVNNQTFLNRLRVDGDAEVNGVLNVQNGVCNFRDIVCSGPASFEQGLITDGPITAPSFITNNENGYGLITTTGGGPVLDPMTNMTVDTGPVIGLHQYTNEGTPGAYAELNDTTVRLGHDVVIDGNLILGALNVQDELQTLADKAKQFLIEQAISVAAEAAQDAVIAALALYANRPPSGYEQVPETGDDSENDKSVSLNPLKLYPSGVFHHLNDLGAEYGVPDVVAQGKVSLNLHGDLCTRTFHMRGDLLQEHQMADDTAEFQSPCLLGSKVATYNTSNQLTNPLVPCVRLGTNALVQTDGTLNAASVNTDSVNTAQVNGINTNRLLPRPVVTRAYDEPIASLSSEVLSLKRGAYTKPVLTRAYDEPIAALSAEVLSLKRGGYTKPVLTRAYDEPIASLSSEVLSLKRGAYTKPVLVKSADMAISRLRADLNSVKHSANKVVLTRNSDLGITRLRTDLNSVKHTANKVVLTRNSDLGLNRVRTDLNSVKHTANKVVLARNSDLGLNRVRTDLNSVKHTANKVVLTKSPDIALTRLRSDLTSVKRATIHPVLTPDFSSKIGVLRDALSTVKAYTSPISTSTSGALKVVGTLNVTQPSTLAGVSATTLGVSGNTLQLASASSNPALFDQGGIMLGTGASAASLLYNNATTNWSMNKGLTVPSLTVTGAISSGSSDPRKYIKTSLSKDATSVAVALYKKSVHVDTVTTSIGNVTTNGYETWFAVGSFTDSCTAKIVMSLDHSDPKLCDTLDIDICYNRSGLTPVITAIKSGNKNTFSYYSFTGVSMSDYALNTLNQLHTVYVGYGTDPANKVFTASVTVRGGNFTLNKPLTYTNPNTSVGSVGPRYDPTYSCINCVAGFNNALVTNLLNGTVNIASALVDRAQVSQLTGRVQSALNPAVNSYITLGSFRTQFSGHVRIVLTTTAQLGNTTQVIDLAVNYCDLQGTSSVVVNSVPSPGVSSTPSSGITTAYLFSGNLAIKGPSIGCNLYWSALNSNPKVDNQGNGNDGWDESTQAISTTAPSGGQVINISNLGNTGFANSVDIAGNLNVSGILTHTGSVASLCQVNTGNRFEFSAGNGLAYIDFHAGLATDDVDYDARMLVANKNINFGALNGVTVSAGALNFGTRTGQLVNLYSSIYGIGVQNATTYFRTQTYFSFYAGGTHSDTTGDSGGGLTLFALNSNTGDAYLKGADGSTTNVVRSHVNVIRSGQKFTPSLSSGVITFGYTFTTSPNVSLTLDDTTPRAICVLGVTQTQFNWVSSGAGTSNMSLRWVAIGNGP